MLRYSPKAMDERGDQIRRQTKARNDPVGGYTVESGYMQLLGNQKKVAYTRKLHISVGKTMLKDFLGAREKLHISGLHISGFYCIQSLSSRRENILNIFSIQQ